MQTPHLTTSSFCQGISLSSLKSACRRLGINRWPGPKQAGADTDDAQEPPGEDDDEDAGPAEDDTGWEEEKLEEGQPHPSAGSEDADWEIQRLLAREGSPGPSGSSTVTETLTQASAPSAVQPICPDWIEEYLRATDEDEM